MKRALALLPVFALFAHAAAFAQVPGALLSSGVAELGIQYRNVHRDISGDVEFDQSHTAISLRYGLTQYATISAELMAADDPWHSEEDLRYYLIGVGVQALIWKRGPSRVTGTYNYNEMMQVATNDDGCHKTLRKWMFILQFEHAWQFGAHDVEAWTGPVYEYFEESINPSSNGCRGGARDVDNRWGLTVGASGALYGRFVLFTQVTYVDYMQPTLGVAYRF